MVSLFEPIFVPIGEYCVTYDMIFNPYYPDKVKYRCKSSRKRINRKVK